MKALIVVAAVFACLVECQIDSMGTEFETIFAWNNGPPESEPNIYMDFVNSDPNVNATVEIRYTEWSASGWDVTLTQRTATVVVGPLSSNKFTFTKASVYQYVNQGLNGYPDTRVYIRSDNPISVVAHNYLPSGVGDSFTVMPTSMAGMEYSLSLPAPSATTDSFGMVYFLPTTTDVTLEITVVTETNSMSYTTKLSIAREADVKMYGGPSKPFTMYVTGNAPFVVIAAVRGLPIGYNFTVQDFGCFMPTPILSSACSSSSLDDDHITDLSSAQNFIFTPPSEGCDMFDIQIYGSNGTSSTVHVVPSRVQSPLLLSNEQYGTSVGIHSDSAVLQAVRYGGYKAGGIGEEDGAFLDLVPSWSQFVTGTTGYVVPNAYDQITIIGDLQTTQTGKHDGNDGLTFTQAPYFGGMAYFAVANVSQGFHYFTSEGRYLIHVAGLNNHTGYGFTPSYNKQEVLPVNPNNTATVKEDVEKRSARNVLLEEVLRAPLAAENGIDSFGTEFEFIIPWSGAVDSTSNIYMDFVNSNANLGATLTVRYNDWSASGWDISLQPTSVTFYVQPMSSTRYAVANTSSYQYINQGLNGYPDTRFYVQSDTPISIIVHNYLTNGIGDSFTVMPRSMAGMEYSLSLPQPSSTTDSFGMVYFLPTTTDTTVTFIVVTDTNSVTYTTKLAIAQGADVKMYGGPSKPFTLYAKGDAPFVVVAAFRGLPTVSGSNAHDFGCFMPTPVASSVCSLGSLDDDHITDLSAANYFIFTPPTEDCAAFDVQLYGSTGTTSSAHIEPSQVQNPTRLSNDDFGINVGIHSDAAVLQAIRYGGYNQGSIGDEYGAFLDLVPSWSQFVTGTTAYVVPTAYDQITIIGDLTTRQTGRHDGNYSVTFSQIPFFGGMAYHALANVAEGFHYFTSEGRYLIHIAGFNNRTAYGYTPSYNRQQVIPLGSTTPGPSTASPATRPGSSAVSSVPPATTTTVAPVTTSTTTTTTTYATTRGGNGNSSGGVSMVSVSGGALLAALIWSAYR